MASLVTIPNWRRGGSGGGVVGAMVGRNGLQLRRGGASMGSGGAGRGAGVAPAVAPEKVPLSAPHQRRARDTATDSDTPHGG